MGGYNAWRTASWTQQLLACLIPILGVPLALILVFQTIAFEGEHSYEAFCRNIVDKKVSLCDLSILPQWLLKGLYYGIYLMPIVHGVAAAAPVFVYCQQLFGMHKKGLFQSNNWHDILKSCGVIVTALFTAIATGVGHTKSEAKEAWHHLEEVVVQ